MLPSSEIVSSLFLFRERLDSTCRELTQIALNRLELAARANCVASPSSFDRKPLRFILATSLSIWFRSLLSVCLYPHHADDACIT